MLHSGEQRVLNKIRQSWCRFTLFNIQSTMHRNNRKSARTHTHGSMWTWRCDCVLELRGNTDREVMANTPDIIIKNTSENTHTDRRANTCGQKWHAKGSRKETKTQQFMDWDTANVEHDMYDYTGNNWSHRNSNKNVKKNLEAIAGKQSTPSLQKIAILEHHI